jgi:hypothetical protein
MEDCDESDSEVDWDDDNELMAVVMVVMNNNTAIINHMMHLEHARGEQQRIQSFNDIMTPN